ncbi:MAG: enoyl-CoA hydratase/isomerase family protein [Alphaproteobacteria bacterium]|nr:enoyl-CoA hydratase/isomerase family protein [Alphaproteobacteria bacterium]
MSQAPNIELRLDGALAWLEIRNPERMNALTAAMWQTLPELLQAADTNSDVRVIIVRGAGERAFCAGADISEFETARSGDNVKDYDLLNHKAFMALSQTVKPTLAMIHGFCLGGGLGLAACCDLRLADNNSQYAIPAAKLGIGYNPRWVTPLLALTSPANVKEILFTGRRIKADEAYQMGLVNRVTAPGSLLSVTRQLAETIAENAPLSVAASKVVINELVHHPENPDLYKLDAAIQRCFESQDYAEGRAAFLGKRRAVFKGQ